MATEDRTNYDEVLDDVLDGLTVVAMFATNIQSAVTAIQLAKAAGRALSDDEIALARQITAQKRALAEAS